MAFHVSRFFIRVSGDWNDSDRHATTSFNRNVKTFRHGILLAAIASIVTFRLPACSGKVLDYRNSDVVNGALYARDANQPLAGTATTQGVNDKENNGKLQRSERAAKDKLSEEAKTTRLAELQLTIEDVRAKVAEYGLTVEDIFGRQRTETKTPVPIP